MKTLATLICLAALLPLGGCVSPYGYRSGAWANYDGGFDSGYQGYDRPIFYRDDYRPAYQGTYGGGYYNQQPDDYYDSQYDGGVY